METPPLAARLCWRSTKSKIVAFAGFGSDASLMKKIEIIPLASKKMARRGVPERWVKETVTSPGGESLMKIEYDPSHDLLNIEFLPDIPIDDSLEVDGIVIDYAKDKRIVAIEVLDASKRTTSDPLDLIDLAIVRAAPLQSDRVSEPKAAYRRKREAKGK